MERTLTWVNNPIIKKYMGTIFPICMSEHRLWYQNLLKETTLRYFAIESKDERKHVGNIALKNIDWKNRKAEMLIYINPEAWGKGYGKDATLAFLKYTFNELNLHRIYLYAAVFNEKAIKMYEALGFQREGLARDDIFCEGRYYDSIRYSFIKHDFK